MISFKELKEKYPLVFPENPICGVSIPNGWERLVDILCSVIQAHLAKQASLGIEIPFFVQQIKEKFHGLRFYYSGGDEFIQIIVAFAEKLSYDITYKYSRGE